MAYRTKKTIQSLLFRRKPFGRFDVRTAKAWARKHRYRSNDVDVKEDYIHLRQRDPSEFDPSTYAVVHFGPSIQARIAHPWIAVSNPHPRKDDKAKALVKVVHEDWTLHREKHKTYERLAARQALGNLDRHAVQVALLRVVRKASPKYSTTHKIPKKVRRNLFSPNDYDRAARILTEEFYGYWKTGKLDQYIPKLAWSKRQEKG
jgi:hypothetical protein